MVIETGALLAVEKSGAKKNLIVNKRPNIIYIFTDQQSGSMMSNTGNPWLSTPAMDYIAENGVRFTKAYCTNPTSTASRISHMTGRMPAHYRYGRFNRQVRENMGGLSVRNMSREDSLSTLGAFLQKSGYEMIYGGKEHLPNLLRPGNQGFKVITNNIRQPMAEKAAEYIKEKHEKPYFMFLSLINPHDICYMAIVDAALSQTYSRNAKEAIGYLQQAQKRPEGVSEEEFYRKYCPPARPNMEIQADEPAAIGKLLEKYPFREYVRNNYTEKQWRFHRWTYCRLTEIVDKEIQIILDALKASGEEENTVVIFSSDHGEMDGAHRMEHKSVLYEESVNIPLLFMWKGSVKPKVDSTHIISNGLDFLPTVCDLAGVDGQADPRGRSLVPLLFRKNVRWRETLGIESEVGRMVISDKGYRYMEYDWNGIIEKRLEDFNRDPMELTHVTDRKEYRKIQEKMYEEFHHIWFPQ